MELLRVIYTRYFVDFKAPDADLSGRVCLITGANTGVGFEAALHLAKRKAETIVFGVRSIPKGQAAAERLYREVPAYRGKVEIWEVDMSNFESVIRFGKRCERELNRLDIAILNAGCFPFKYSKTGDGWETTLQVNVLATGLLGMLLLPKLSQAAKSGASLGDKPHLSIVSSDTQYFAAFASRKSSGPLLDALNDPKYFSADTYNVSKLLEVYLVREMAVLPKASGVVVNAVNPGLTTSELRRDTPGWFQSIFGSLAWPTEKGSRNYIYAVLTETTPGAFIHCCKERESASLVTSAEGQRLQKKFWAEVTELYQSLLAH